MSGKTYSHKKDTGAQGLVFALLVVLAVIVISALMTTNVHAAGRIDPVVSKWTESAEHSEKYGNSLSGCQLIGGYNAEIITCDLGQDDIKEKDSENTSIVENAPIVELVTNEPIRKYMLCIHPDG